MAFDRQEIKGLLTYLLTYIPKMYLQTNSELLGQGIQNLEHCGHTDTQTRSKYKLKTLP